MFAAIGVAIAGIVGKSVSDKAAKVIGWTAVIVAAVIAFGIGKAIYDANLIDDYEDKVQGELAEDTLAAERQANAAKEGRDEEFARDQGAIEGAMSDAAERDPEGAGKPVGPVSQSYFDGVRDAASGRP